MMGRRKLRWPARRQALSRFALSLLAVVAAMALFGHTAAHAAVPNGRLIDDSVFENSTAMSAGDIQAFLNQFPSSCLKNYTDVMPDANPVNAYFNYSGSGSAAQIISRVATDYGVNPRVILTKLEQEESLVSGGQGCSLPRYASAIGFNCPGPTRSATFQGQAITTCVQQDANMGFSHQITKGTWLLKISERRADGDLSWMIPDDASWYYGGPMTPGTRQRSSSSPAIYYDGSWTSANGTTVQIQTGATAALYWYTPFVPSAFPTIWEGWWGVGSTLANSVGYYGQSAYPTLLPGQSTTAYFEYKNNGAQTWYDDTGLSDAPSGTFAVHLGTSNPVNRASVFGASWNANQNRPDFNFTAVYNSDGSTLATNQHAAAPGQIIKFQFTLAAPASITPGVYREFFQPLEDGTPDGNMSNPGTYLDVTVQPFSYAPQYHSQSAYPSLLSGQSNNAYFEYKNAGNVAWYDDSGLSEAPAGTLPIHLATSHPINRASAFGSSWGANHNRPDFNFSAVYNSDGSTLASDQHMVAPGQIVKFGFTINVPASTAPGVYREFFQPLAEGSSDGGMPDPGTYLDVTVQPTIYAASYYSQSSYPSMNAGGSSSANFMYKNAGNVTWYDDTGLGEAPAGTMPVHLATSHPINRNSSFGSAWGANHNRPNFIFSAVYNSDGSTLASDQHAVAPSQIVKFTFTFNAPSNLATGVYREFFQPIVEGTGDGAIGDVGTYLDITIH